MLAAAQVVAAVAALITSAGVGAVHTSRTWPLAETDVPAWRVVAEDEEVSAHGIGFPAKQQHDLEVCAHGYARETANLDAALSDMAAAAITALFQSRATAHLSPLNCSMQLKRIARDMVTEGEAALGRVSLTLLVRFFTSNNAPESII